MRTLELQNIKKVYSNNKRALNDINLKIHAGEKIAILGPSGSGKSTLLKVISGLEKQDSGKVLLDDREVFNIAREGLIGFVFQDVNAVFPHLTVYENVRFPLTLRVRKDGNNYHDHIMQLLDFVDLVEQKDRRPKGMSGGELQRISIARALVYSPDIFLFDEPLSSLDNILKREILNLITKIQKSFNTTILYVTHDEREALEISDRIAVLDKGNLLQFDYSSALYTNPISAKVAQTVGGWNLLPGKHIKENSISKLHLLDEIFELSTELPSVTGEVLFGFQQCKVKVFQNRRIRQTNDEIFIVGPIRRISQAQNGMIITLESNNHFLQGCIDEIPQWATLDQICSFVINIENLSLWNLEL